MNKERLNWWILFGVVTLTLVPFLGMCLYNTKGEPREAIVAVTMLQTGDWILPMNYGDEMQFKPPFLYWCIASLSWLLGDGHVTEFLSRLPSAIAAIAMVMTGYTLFRRRKGDAVALAMAAMTFTAFEVQRAATSCRLDMLVTAFIVTAIYALYRWCESGRARYAVLATVLMACGALTKGPVAAVLPCLVIGAYRLIRGDRFWGVVWRLAVIGVCSLVPLALWYVAAFKVGGDKFYDLMMEENLGRFTGTMSYDSHANPVYYNFITLISGLLPYTLMLLFSLFSLRWVKPRCERGCVGRLWRRVKGLDSITLLSLLTVVVIFLFYCIPESKRSVYLLPIYPFLAYFMALYVRWLARRGARSLRVFGWVFVVIALVLPIAYMVMRTGCMVGLGSGSLAQSIEGLSYGDLPWWGIVLIVLSFNAALMAIKPLVKSSASTCFALTVGVIVTLYWTYSAVYQPQVLNVKSDYAMSEALMREFPDQPEFYSYDCQLYVMNFYTSDRVRWFNRANPRQGIVVMDPEALTKFVGEHPAAVIEPVWSSPDGYRSGDTRSPLAAYKFRL